MYNWSADVLAPPLTVDRFELLKIERACIKLCAAFASRIDAQDISVADLFIEDARLRLPGYDLSGKEQIRQYVHNLPTRQGEPTRHVCWDTAIELFDHGLARGMSDIMAFVAHPTTELRGSRSSRPLL